MKRYKALLVCFGGVGVLTGCCTTENGKTGHADNGGVEHHAITLDSVQSPTRPAIGERVTLTVESNQEVVWEVDLPRGWSRRDEPRTLTISGRTPLGSAGVDRAELTVFAIQGDSRTPLGIEVVARAKQTTARAREIRRRNVGISTLVFYEVTTDERPIRWPQTAGHWQLHFDTAGLGPGDSISVDDAENGWEGLPQEFGPNARPSQLNDARRDPAEWFRFTSPSPTEAILDGAFTVTVQVANERAEQFDVKPTITLILE